MSVFLSGCATSLDDKYRSKISKENFRELSEIRQADYRFASAKYTGKQRLCFPPIGGRSCESLDTDSYAEISPLNLEVLYIRFPTALIFTKTENEDDLLNLAMAEVTLQRGFKYFTILGYTENTRCSSSPSAITTGSMFNNTFIGTTTYRNDSYCFYAKSTKFLLFNDPSDLSEGVFLTGQRRGESKPWVKPFKELYIGTMLDSNFEDFASQDGGLFRIPTYHAWRDYYDAIGVKNDYSRKLAIKSAGTYKVDTSSVKPSSQEDDVMERNRRGKAQ
jgi:hypothetical protein